MSIGLAQLLLILLIILLVFGAGKLPKVMSDLGKGLKSFKSAMNEDDSNKKDES
jgi:sec-independent protein translocase protein TatA